MRPQVIINKKEPHAKALIALALFFLARGFSFGQCFVEKSVCAIYNIDSQEMNYAEYVVKNKTQDTVYIWIDTATIGLDSLTSEQKDILLFLKYIRNPKCEIGLDFMCHDGCINFGKVLPPPPVIGCTFIKKMHPGESFVVISLKNSIGPDAIHSVKKEIVERFLKIDRLDEIGFDKSYILVW